MRAAALELALWIAWALVGGALLDAGMRSIATDYDLSCDIGFNASVIVFTLTANLIWTVMEEGPESAWIA